MYKHIFKRLLDFTLSLIGLVVISPLLVVVWVLLLVANGGAGAVFVQTRPGKGGRLFRVIKFKTMNEKRDSEGNLLPAVNRITPVGKFMRSLSLDELPQLFNVLKGDMSLIGPRPLRVEYLPLYSARQAKRHDVRPGVSGWAQVNGRNAISWEEKFELDVWYVENLSFWLDIKILFITIWNVISRKGINQDDNSTMQPFKGAKLDG
jgi:lipopolysaccharide/colanic/teichoic acid biosynthesis glycosyltransferase